MEGPEAENLGKRSAPAKKKKAPEIQHFKICDNPAQSHSCSSFPPRNLIEIRISKYITSKYYHNYA